MKAMASKSAISILLLMTTTVMCERWARQIPANGFTGSAANDWIPVPCPTCKSNDRQQGGRVLNFAHTAQASNQQQQFIQNVIPHQKHWQHPKIGFNEEPMRLVSQGFLVPPQPNQQQFGFVNQYPQFAYQHENQQQYLQRVPIPQVNNLQFEYIQQPQQQQQQQQQQNIPQPLAEALIMQKPQVFDKNELQSHINQLPQQQQQQQPEEVQLLYVPLDTLYQQKQQQGNEASRHNLIPPNVNPHQINNFYTASPAVSPTPVSNSIPSYRPTESPSSYERTKIKSNQPPLSMFMKNKVRNSEISIGEVLSALKNAKNIDVLDSASKKSPKVFVGPSGLKTPEGYTKFELPYLSSIEQDRPNRQINNLPFFVAPLSYHAPDGFAKIPLPSPHVGSVVVNSPDNAVESAINSEAGFSQRHPSFYQPTDFQTQQFYEQNFNFFNPTTASFLTIPTTTTTTTTTTTPRPTTAVPTSRSTTQRQTTPRPIQRHTTRKPNLGFRFGSNVFPSTSEQYQSAYEQTENPTQSFDNQYYPAPVSSTTERNFEYYNRDQDLYNRPSISSSTQNPFDFFNKNNNFNSNAPRMPSTIDPTFESKNRGQPIDSSRTKEYEFPKYSNLDAYKTFKPIPTAHVTNEEYFNIDNKDSTNSFSTNQRPEQYNENTSQTPFVPSNSQNENVNFRGKYTFNETPSISKENKVEETYQSQTVKPIEYSTKAQEILKMKSHFLEQNSQHTRPNLPSSEPVTQRTFSYTPVTISYENLLKPLSSTANYDFFSNIKNSEDSSSDAKPPKISYFTPTPNYDEVRPEKPKEEEQVKYFKYSIIEQKSNAPESSSPLTKDIDEATEEPVSVGSPSIGNTYWESNNRHYNGPSTLRPVQSLPGLINGLMDETSEKTLPSTTETVNIPRRTPTRRRRPDTTHSPSTSTTENSARRTTFRGRRPIHYANRTTTVRTTVARNTSRVRYNPTPEERQQLRSQSPIKKESENLDYQRDVLKQNYPIISRNPSTDAPTIEKLSSSYALEPESQKTNSDVEYTVVNEREDVITREDDTTAVPITTLRPTLTDNNPRPNFRQTVRKTQRFGTTTTASPSSAATQAPERLSRDRYTVRPRTRYELTTQPTRTTKKRTDLRQRRPTTTRPSASSTVSAKDESNNDSYQQISRFNTDFYQESTPSTVNHRGGSQQKNHRYSGSHFGLKSEETRWSVKSNQSSFQPIDPEADIEEDTFVENEPMIVTAQSYSDQDFESFNIPVKQSFDFASAPTTQGDTIGDTVSSTQESVMETLFEDLVNEIVTDSKKNEILPEETDNSALSSNRKTNLAESNVEKKGQRRGVWKRIRVRPLDGFETAESQNYGQQYINHIPNVDLKEEKIKQFDFGITSTMEAITNKAEIETTTASPTELEQHTEPSAVLENDSTSTSTTTESEIISTTEVATEAPVEITTTFVPEDQSNILTTVRSIIDAKIEETTTQHDHDRNDAQVTEGITDAPLYEDYDTERIFTETQNESREEDQEPQSSIFSEVKQKLTDLFTIDNDYDYQENNLPLKMQQYTTIERNKSLNQIPTDEADKKSVKTVEAVTEASSLFHKNLMDSVIYATSTSTEVSHETEICYRGRCIKTDKKLKT
ncbi:putative mediator of RNA polymerase II transcription subunit 26 [Bradysia coprophila]|uniref:putative mediator of RNA polymerase II transcription subunit 26 n=1 Tax=Bradysia coprophila TaxID=38358 RepID=UPI00187DC7A9|nr:putative mediator of RNA polymerase II transcription subunit 26 [Bradysia coprophila]